MIRRSCAPRSVAMPAVATPVCSKNARHKPGAARALFRALALGLALCPVLAPSAGATAPRRGHCCVYIAVESRYGTGTVTAAVRQGLSGRPEVRLPGRHLDRVPAELP
jgi:hypothetical protein